MASSGINAVSFFGSFLGNVTRVGLRSISTGSETYSGRQWGVSRGGSSIENDEFVVVVCVVHLGVVVIRVASRIAILFFVNY